MARRVRSWPSTLPPAPCSPSCRTPAFDPNTLIGPSAGEAGQTLESDPEEPLRNRVTDESYPPGSVFKVITTASGLDTGLVSPSTLFPDPVELELPGSQSTIKNFNGEVCDEGTEVTLEFAFIHSCNTTFAQLGMDLGGNQLATTANRFGFNQPIPFDLDVLTSFFPDGETLEENLPATAQSAIGQRDVQTTPFVMALTAGAVANEGTMMSPYLVYDVFTSDGVVESSTVPEPWRRAMSPATAAVLADLMEQVVVSGTGSRAAVPGIRIAGKTGTAQVTGKAPPRLVHRLRTSRTRVGRPLDRDCCRRRVRWRFRRICVRRERCSTDRTKGAGTLLRSNPQLDTNRLTFWSVVCRLLPDVCC